MKRQCLGISRFLRRPASIVRTHGKPQTQKRCPKNGETQKSSRNAIWTHIHCPWSQVRRHADSRQLPLHNCSKSNALITQFSSRTSDPTRLFSIGNMRSPQSYTHTLRPSQLTPELRGLRFLRAVVSLLKRSAMGSMH